MKNLLTSLFALGAALVATPLSGAVLADYSFPTTDAAGFQSQDADIQTTAAALFVNNLGTLGAASNGYGISSFKNIDGTAPQFFIRADATDGNSQATAFDNEEYFGFSLTPEAGLQVTYTSLTFNYVFDASQSYTSTIFLRSSADNYSSNLASLDFTTNTTETYAPQNISLASLGTLDEAVTFRFYIFDSATTTGNPASASIHRIDDIVLNGDVSVIPEPSATLLLLGGLGTLAFLRRRRM